MYGVGALGGALYGLQDQAVVHWVLEALKLGPRDTVTTTPEQQRKQTNTVKYCKKRGGRLQNDQENCCCSNYKNADKLSRTLKAELEALSYPF